MGEPHTQAVWRGFAHISRSSPDLGQIATGVITDGFARGPSLTGSSAGSNPLFKSLATSVAAVEACRHGGPVQIAHVDAIHELLATRDAAAKLGARIISVDEAQQLINNRYVIVRNAGRRRRHERELARRLVIGRTDGGRVVTLVVERTSRADDMGHRHRLGCDGS